MQRHGRGRLSLIVAAAAAASSALGCQRSEPDEPRTTGTPTSNRSLITSAAAALPITPESTVSSSPAAPFDPSLQPMIDQAIADLASRLNVDKSAIATISAAPVTWPDRSLGCPQAGMAYAQVTVDGTLIVLSANGSTHSYHSGGARAPFRCDKG